MFLSASLASRSMLPEVCEISKDVTPLYSMYIDGAMDVSMKVIYQQVVKGTVTNINY